VKLVGEGFGYSRLGRIE